MKSLIRTFVKSFMAIIAVAYPLLVSAHDFQVDGIYYNIIVENSEVAVTYMGESYDAIVSEYEGKVVIPETVVYDGVSYRVTTIGEKAFAYCYDMTTVEMPNSVTTIGERSFWQCNRLKKLTLSENLTSIGSWAFAMCRNIESVNIPIGVTVVDDYTFFGCSNITSLTIGESVQSICNSAFSGCESVPSVVIPNSVTVIEDNAFYECKSMASLSIGSNVLSIGMFSFGGCESLAEIYTKSVVPPQIVKSTFGNYNAKLYVPYGCADVYKVAEYWCNFLDVYEDNTAVSTVKAKKWSVIAVGGTLYIDGVCGDKMVRVYNVSGVLQYSCLVSHSTGYVLPSGIYIVEVDGKTCKVSV